LGVDGSLTTVPRSNKTPCRHCDCKMSIKTGAE